MGSGGSGRAAHEHVTSHSARVRALLRSLKAALDGAYLLCTPLPAQVMSTAADSAVLGHRDAFL
jgi:hypothetical protein